MKHITGTTADIFLEYIQRNLPEGVDMSVYQVPSLTPTFSKYFKKGFEKVTLLSLYTWRNLCQFYPFILKVHHMFFM